VKKREREIERIKGRKRERERERERGRGRGRETWAESKVTVGWVGWDDMRVRSVLVVGARLGLAPLVLPVLIACSFPPLDTTSTLS